MEKSGEREVGRANKDRISEMPWDIQEIIFCNLPIRDAVSPKGYVGRESISTSFTTESTKVVSIIEKVLELHNGPILKFFLRFPQDCDAQIIDDHIGQWILLFSRKGIKQLNLQIPDISAKINAHDFSSLDLTHLRLTRVYWFPCRLTFVEFTCLTDLELELVHAFNSEQNIYKCPVLEKLTLKNCTELSPINFHAPNLRCIYEISKEITLFWLENLKEYSFGLCSFCWPTDTITSNLVKVLGSLHKIEKFSIGLCFIEYLAEGGCPDRLPNQMPCLKSLNIYNIDLAQSSEVFCLLCLIRSAPNLCKLHISVDWVKRDAAKGNLKNYWDKISEDCTIIDQLEAVTLCELGGLSTELDLIKFILASKQCSSTIVET